MAGKGTSSKLEKSRMKTATQREREREREKLIEQTYKVFFP